MLERFSLKKIHSQSHGAELHHRDSRQSVHQLPPLAKNRLVQQQHLSHRLRCILRIKISQLARSLRQQDKRSASWSLQRINVAAVVAAKCQRDIVHPQRLFQGLIQLEFTVALRQQHSVAVERNFRSFEADSNDVSGSRDQRGCAVKGKKALGAVQ